MFSFAHMVHFLSHELSRLGASRFSFARIFPSAFNDFFFRHCSLPFPQRVVPSQSAKTSTFFCKRLSRSL